jgi:hypothetical protein
MTYESEVLADSPLVYWRLDESSGQTAADSSGNGNDGWYGDSTFLTGGSQIDGVPEGFIDSADAVYANARDGLGSVTLNVGATGVGQDVGYRCFQAFFSFDCSSLSGDQIVTAAIAKDLQTGFVAGESWNLVLAVYDWGPTLTTSAFRTGAQLAGLTILDSRPADGSGITDTYTWAFDPSNVPTSGTLKCIVFSDQQIGSGSAPTGTDTAGDPPPLFGSITPHLELEVLGTGPTLGVTGLITNDPSDTAISLANDDTTNFQVRSKWPGPANRTLSAFTCEAWINVSDPRLAYNFSDFFSMSNDSSLTVHPQQPNTNIDIWIEDDGTGSPGLRYFFQADSNIWGPSASVVTIATNTAYYIALTWDGTTAKFYVNSVLVDTQAPGPTDTFSVGLNEYLRAGCDGIGVGDGFNGTLDEVAFYDHALDSTRISAHYGAGIGGQTSQALTVTATQTPTLSPSSALPFPSYAFMLDTNIFGAGSNNSSLEKPFIDGLGVPDAKAQQVDYFFADGAYANPDYLSVRVITFHVIIRAPQDPVTVMTALKLLETTFSERTSDLTLHISLPSWGLFSVTGRPRGLIADLTQIRFGVAHALCRFDCHDPTITYG